jgi:ELP3 family radical SAM enzyme/protein acetyltransferase
MTKDIEDTVKQVKAVRSWSGVLVVTLVMKPDKFSCPNDCHMCPAEPGQPRSYLSTEPAVSRANKNDFDPVKQFNDRLNMLHKNGHTLDKIEIIVLGGTFSSYPRDYQEEFIRDIFYAANVYPNMTRERCGILEEKEWNEKAEKKIIGISLETRPDHITKYELKRFRKLGCTRIQIGVQHTDNEILKKINRGHTIEQSKKAMELIKQTGFKLDVHIMPDLPGATPEGDKEMIKKILTDEEFVPDYLKLYPCLDVEYTEIRKWKENKEWKPYAEMNEGQTLLDVCLVAKEYSKEYIRYNRIQRDFPEERPDVVGYASKYIRNNFRQMLQNHAKKKGITCYCIRCREVKKRAIEPQRVETIRYRSSGGQESFISIKNWSNDTLYGFIRLRMQKESPFRELVGIALIRELHVYGFLQGTNIHTKSSLSQVQHRGFGKVLMAKAENDAFRNGYNQIAVISGVGVIDYYRRHGYILKYETEYMYKDLSYRTALTNQYIVMLFFIKNVMYTIYEYVKKRKQCRVGKKTYS